MLSMSCSFVRDSQLSSIDYTIHNSVYVLLLSTYSTFGFHSNRKQHGGLLMYGRSVPLLALVCSRPQFPSEMHLTNMPRIFRVKWCM